jgi:hypothetical protein
MSGIRYARQLPALRRVATGLVLVLAFCLLSALTGCSETATEDTATHRAPDESPNSAPSAAASTARTPMPAPRKQRSTSLAAPTADAVIEEAGRPVAGAINGRRVLLIYVTRDATAIRVATPDGVADHLLNVDVPRYYWTDHATLLTPYREQFAIIVEPEKRGWLVNARGVPRTLGFSNLPTRPAPGDVLVNRSEPTINSRGRPAFTGNWLLRPSTHTVITRPELPLGAHITHTDGHGTLWAIAPPQNGQSVLLSLGPSGEWGHHVVGRYSPTFAGCACDTDPGPHGRAGVLVLAGLPLQHVSTDYGKTWQTYDVRSSTPYRHVQRIERFPMISALADGRLVIGYDQFWVADDATNTSFTKLRDPLPTLWAADLYEYLPLILRGDRASPDGGRTWVNFRP